MTELQKLIDKLNELKITQQSIDWLEDLPEVIYTNYFQEVPIVASNLDVDKHRWYETAVDVLPVAGGFIGVRYVQGIFNEMDSVSDLYWTLIFFEMEEFTTVSYKQK